MCLIIAPGKDGKKALLPRDVFDYVYSRNDDGFGAMWTEDGKVGHFKTLGLSGDEIYAQMEEYTERFPNVIFHMRYRTHGKVTPGLCHPFRILHRSRHGKDLLFMHNGVLGSFGKDLKPGQSDTTNFKDKILVPLLTRNPEALADPETLEAINKLTTGSRLLFLDSTGEMTITSKSSWNERYGLLLSNEYMLPTENKWDTYTMGTPGSSYSGSSSVYNAYRSIKYVNGTVRGQWCSIPKAGFVRTEAGLLYIDLGVNTPIEHEKWFIKRENEGVALAAGAFSPAKESAKTLLTLVDKDEDEEFKDDELPWKDAILDEDEEPGIEDDYTPAVSYERVDTTVGEAVASQDERFRYARFVHNCHAGKVANRPQLMADLMCSGKKELEDLVKADPETAHTILSEVFEIFIEQNDVLYRDAATEIFAFNPDEMLEHGLVGHHRKGMQSITESRRKEYVEMVKARSSAIAASYPADTGSEVMEG